jgi:hypothetical protein
MGPLHLVDRWRRCKRLEGGGRRQRHCKGLRGGGSGAGRRGPWRWEGRRR